MKIYSGSVSGPLHDRKEIPNQDSYGSLEKDGVLFIVASDGAGSHELSHLGSKLVVESCLKSFEEDYHSGDNVEEFLLNVIESARSELLKEEESGSMGCTLSIAMMNDREWGCGVVGDSFAVVGCDGSYERFSCSGKYEYANYTDLLTSSDPNIEIYHEEYPVEIIAVGSDGLDTVSVQDDNAYSAFWDSLVRRTFDDSLNVEDFLNFLKKSNRISDDTTLVMGVR